MEKHLLGTLLISRKMGSQGRGRRGGGVGVGVGDQWKHPGVALKALT